MSPRDEVSAPDRMSTQDDVGVAMARYGITRVPADMFHYREYRYSRLSEAVAQAKRDAKAPAGPK